MFNYTEKFLKLKALCISGHADDIDLVMEELDNADLPTTRAVDFYLGLVDNPFGFERIEHYLFNGTQIQRNYCTLFFARRNEWKKVNEAFRLGLVDRIQAYSR